MEQIRNSKNGEKLFYENVVQVGNSLIATLGHKGSLQRDT